MKCEFYSFYSLFYRLILKLNLFHIGVNSIDFYLLRNKENLDLILI